ncbi:MAG: hypothetical protein M3Z10_04400 [Gemmatimonadota bacterium]|nr:hypothetical protein [Gemmatimonadota bacterium]
MSAASPASGNDARRLRATKASDDAPVAQPRLEEFDALVRALLPAIKQIAPHLSEVEALQAATRMAEYRLRDEAELIWGRW